MHLESRMVDGIDCIHVPQFFIESYRNWAFFGSTMAWRHLFQCQHLSQSADNLRHALELLHFIIYDKIYEIESNRT